MFKLNRIEWAALGAACVARIAAHLSLLDTGHARNVLVDAYTYWSQASSLASGKDPFVEGFYQPPGYPFLLAQVQSVFGDTLMAPRVLQQCLGLVTMVLLMRLGRSIGGREWTGAAAGLLYGLYGPALMFELDLLTPATVALVVSVVLILVEFPSSRRVGVAACLAALAAAVHPSMLLLALAVVAVSWIRGAGLGAAVLGLCLGLLPMTSANVDRFGQWQVGSNNAGINFYIGNNSDWKETTFTRAGLRFRKLALEAEPHRRDSFERNGYWRSRAFSDIAAAPHQWVGALGTRAVWSINAVEIPRNEDHRCRTGEGPMAWFGWLPVRYGWVFPFALLGFVFACRDRKRWGVLWVSLHAPLVLFIVSDRYRLASWPVLCVLAPLGFQQAMAWFQERNVKRLLGLGAVGLLPFIPIDPRTEVDPAWCAHTEANLAVADGDLERAEALYVQAVSADPDDWSARRWLAVTLMKRGRFSEALEHVDAVLNGFPDSFPMLRLRASIEERRGNYLAAAEAMVLAYKVPGERTSTGLQALRLLEKAGEAGRMRDLLANDSKLNERWRRKKGR